MFATGTLPGTVPYGSNRCSTVPVPTDALADFFSVIFVEHNFVCDEFVATVVLQY